MRENQVDPSRLLASAGNYAKVIFSARERLINAIIASGRSVDQSAHAQLVTNQACARLYNTVSILYVF